jgi:hypothetical protein
MSEEEELATYLFEETTNTYPEAGAVSPEIDEENLKSHMPQAKAIVKFLRAHGLL